MLLRSDPALGLTGRHATSKTLRETGFDFQFATLDAALTDLILTAATPRTRGRVARR
ncbi:MAG: uncharacterized protein QOF25_3117 [Mycobacterium sp.]|nr:uncharacterized protein [Mycobacterium sp.]